MFQAQFALLAEAAADCPRSFPLSATDHYLYTASANRINFRAGDFLTPSALDY